MHEQLFFLPEIYQIMKERSLNQIPQAMCLVLFLLAVPFHTVNSQELPFPLHDDFDTAVPGELVINQDSLNGYKADFGLLCVLEDRGNPESRLLYLPLVKIHSLADEKADPVFLFEGGPGLSNLNLNNLPVWLLEHHDIIRVGYRGVDGSVSLSAPEIKQVVKALPEGLSEEGLKLIGKAYTESAQRLRNEGIRVEEYTIQNVVGDMEDARKALGYERINVSGGSFGGAVCYTYCMDYPASIHRAILSEAAFPFDIALAPPTYSDAQLERLSLLWKNDEDASKRSGDIAKTIQNVLTSLPQSWNGIPITEDKMRLMIYFGLYTKVTTAQVFDAFIAAETENDYSGLAFMAFYWNQVAEGFNWGDMVAKSLPTRVSTLEEINDILDRGNSIIGSPLAEMAWGPVQFSEWPIKTSSAPDRTKSSLVETLFIYGSQESASQAKEEFLPKFDRGQLVVFENLGHMDIGGDQAEASQYMESRFFFSGVVDKSKFVESEANPVSFAPKVTFQDMAKQYIQQQNSE